MFIYKTDSLVALVNLDEMVRHKEQFTDFQCQ